MRFVVALIVAIAMLWAVPMLWQRAMIAQVKKVQAGPSAIPVGEAVITNFDEVGNIAAAVNPAAEINTEEYEAAGVQSRADDAMRQAQRAQDQAYDATH